MKQSLNEVVIPEDKKDKQKLTGNGSGEDKKPEVNEEKTSEKQSINS